MKTKTVDLSSNDDLITRAEKLVDLILPDDGWPKGNQILAIFKALQYYDKWDKEKRNALAAQKQTETRETEDRLEKAKS